VADEPAPADQASGAGAALAERYEQLRAAALGGGAEGWRLGLGVLAGKGVAGWIRAWTTCPAPATTAPMHTVLGRTPGPAPSGPEGVEMVRVLAAMALAHA
jgi:hypothetical protein